MDTNTENKKKLRTGFTTGSCATASSKAGVLSIINQKEIEKNRHHIAKTYKIRYSN